MLFKCTEDVWKRFWKAQHILHVLKDRRPKMAHGDGSHSHYLMFGGLYLPFHEPVFPEQHYITRGDGFVPRRILPFVIHNWQHHPNRAERRVPALERERAADNINSLRTAGTEPLLGDTDEISASTYRIMKRRILVWMNLTRQTLTSKSSGCWDSVMRAKRFVGGKLRSLFQHFRRH